MTMIMKMMIMIMTWDYYTKNDTLHSYTFLNKNSLNIQQTLYYYTMNTNFTKTFHIHQINSKHNQHKTHKPSKIETQTTHCIQTRPQITRTNRKDTTAQTHTHTHQMHPLHRVLKSEETFLSRALIPATGAGRHQKAIPVPGPLQFRSLTGRLSVPVFIFD